MLDCTRVKSDFSKAAPGYSERAILQQKVLRDLLVRIRPLIAKKARILDAGCGTGHLGRMLPRSDITQIDIAYTMCTESAKGGRRTINGTIESLPFADASFDVVFSSLVLQWVPDWKKALEEMKRVTKPGGLVAVSTFGKHSLRELKRSFLEADNYPHVLPFVVYDKTWQKDTITEYYPDFRSIMHSLRVIGANNKLMSRRKSLMTINELRRAEAFYIRNYSGKSGLPVTWEVLYHVSRA